MCVKQVLTGWKLIFGYKVQRQQIRRTVEWFLTNQNPGYRKSPSVWTCLMHMQIRRMTVGHVSFHWTRIILHSVISGSRSWRLLVDQSGLINWTSPFPILEVSSVLLQFFIEIHVSWKWRPWSDVTFCTRYGIGKSPTNSKEISWHDLIIIIVLMTGRYCVRSEIFLRQSKSPFRHCTNRYLRYQ